jgi:hypothetical protein
LLASEWVRVKSELEDARRDSDAAQSALGRLVRQSSILEEAARRVLAIHGFGIDVDASLASTIRAQRTIVRTLVENLKTVADDLSTATGDFSRNSEQVVRIDRELESIAEETGLGHLGHRITVEKVQDARDVQRKFADLEDARRQVRLTRQALDALTGPWSTSLSTGEITREMSAVKEQVERRAHLEKIKTDSEAAMQMRAPQGSRAAEILADPDKTPDIIQILLDETLASIDEKDRERDDVLVTTGRLEKDLEGLVSQSDLPDIQQQREQADTDRRNIAIRGAALLLAQKIVSDVKDEVERANQPAVIRRASEIAVSITGGDWSGLVVTDDNQIAVGQNGAWMDQLALSAGARDVLRLCIRIAFAEHHAEKTGVALPLILDDPTSSVDENRAPRLFDVLAECSRRHQVIMMTHDPATVASATAVGATEVKI